MALSSVLLKRSPRRGCDPRLVLVLLLGICIVWIVVPGDAQQRWNVKDDWQSIIRPEENSFYAGISLRYDGVVIVRSTENIRFYTVQDFTFLRELPIQAGGIIYSPDRSMMAVRPQSTASQGTVRIYDSTTGTLRHELDNPTDERLRRIGWSADSRVVLVQSNNVTTIFYRYWDAETGQRISPPFAQPANVYDLAFSPDGSMVYFSIPDTMTAIRTTDGQELFERLLRVEEFQPSPDGSVLLAYERGQLYALRAADGALLWQLAGASNPLRFSEISTVAISPDNRYLAIGQQPQGCIILCINDTGQIALVDMHDGTIVRRYAGQFDGIRSLGFTPDSKTLLSSNGAEVARWDVAPLPPWLIWLPIAGIVLVLIHTVWQAIARKTKPRDTVKG